MKLHLKLIVSKIESFYLELGSVEPCDYGQFCTVGNIECPLDSHHYRLHVPSVSLSLSSSSLRSRSPNVSVKVRDVKIDQHFFVQETTYYLVVL